MEIRQLKYFVAIIDCGSLSGAAREVFVAQSALSKQVLELEKELGVQLLHRSRNGVSATDPGKVFYEYAQGILKHLQDARVAVLDSAQTLSGSVVVALPQSVASPLALPLLRAVAARYPHISLNLNEELTGNLFEQLLYGRIDLALFTDVGLPAEIAFSPLLQEDFYWLSAATDPQPPGTGALTLEQALARPLVWPGLAHGHCTRVLVEAALAKQGAFVESVALEVNSVHILKSAVEAGIGPTIMPLNLARREVDEGRLIARRIDCPGLNRRVGLCVSTRMPSTPARQAVADLIRQVVSDMCLQDQWPGSHVLTAGPA